MEIREIYIYSPSNIVSGGVNSLHLLCKALISKGFNAKMYYIEPPAWFFENRIIKQFNVPYCVTINDSETSLLVVPEAVTNLLGNFSKLQKMVYWLGIYFYFKSKPHRSFLTFKPFRRLFYCSNYFGQSANWFHKIAKQVNYWNKANDPIWSNGTLHISNSQYAAEFVKSMGVQQVFVLHNPVRNEFYDHKVNAARSKTILFGPKMPNSIINKVAKTAKGFECIRLKRLNPETLSELYQKAMLFVELGNFSGRDRMPREAVLSGCVIISSTNGSAAHYNDLQLPEYYKINTHKPCLTELINKIAAVTANYSYHYGQMQTYIDYLNYEKNEFENTVSGIFTRLVQE